MSPLSLFCVTKQLIFSTLYIDQCGEFRNIISNFVFHCLLGVLIWFPLAVFICPGIDLICSVFKISFLCFRLLSLALGHITLFISDLTGIISFVGLSNLLHILFS